MRCTGTRTIPKTSTHTSNPDNERVLPIETDAGQLNHCLRRRVTGLDGILLCVFDCYPPIRGDRTSSENESDYCVSDDVESTDGEGIALDEESLPCDEEGVFPDDEDISWDDEGSSSISVSSTNDLVDQMGGELLVSTELDTTDGTGTKYILP